MNALIVDDSKPARTILSRVLAGLDFHCHEAANGQEALDLLPRIGRPDLVTINLHMPVMDGLELIGRLRRDPSYRGLRLMMVSGEQDQSRIAAALAAGADQFVAKPFTPDAIARALAGIGVGRRPAAAAPIRVLVVDDSAVIRSVLTTTLAAEAGIAVAGTAADGRQALERVAADTPDIVLLDVEMPVMDGITALRELRRLRPRLPVVMFSSLTERGAKAAIDALVSGANDYVAKPKAGTPDEVAACIRAELVPKIRQLVPRAASPVADGAGAIAPPSAAPPVRRQPREVAAVVVAVSTGGPNALAGFLPGFAATAGVPVLVVQHMPPMFTAHLAERLARICGIDVREATDGEVLRPGRVLLAPGGRHMKVVRGEAGVAVALSDDPPENACRPAADPLFRSAATVWGAGTLGVVLTGMGRDGLEGSRAIVAAGGAVIVQDEFTSTIWGMPGHVARAGLADAVLPLSQLGAEVALRLKRRGG